MAIAACGMACDVCKLKLSCGGCVPGTDSKARERQEAIKKEFGAPCPILDCAIKNKVDYCLGCASFPCDVHYQAGLPYSKTLLDLFKKFSAN